MTSMVFDFDHEEDMAEAAARLWEDQAVSGEILCHALDDGRWRMEVVAEQAIPPSLLDSLKGHRVES